MGLSRKFSKKNPNRPVLASILYRYGEIGEGKNKGETRHEFLLFHKNQNLKNYFLG